MAGIKPTFFAVVVIGIAMGTRASFSGSLIDVIKGYSSDYRNEDNENGQSQIHTDWEVGDCIMGKGSNVAWSGDTLTYHLLVKTKKTTNVDIFGCSL